MIELIGKYNKAEIFTDNIENSALSQLMSLLNQESLKDSKIRIMPDVHAGKGCVIGTTMTIKDKVIPNLVGVDIGCGMRVIKLKNTRLELPKLDSVIHKSIPAGFSIRDKEHKYANNIDLNKLRCAKYVNLDRAYKSIGTLGGGNHFIEVDKADDGSLYLVVHTGSRNLGKGIAEHYQDKAWKALNNDNIELKKKEIIAKLKAEGKQSEIESAIKQLTVQSKSYGIPYELAYCEGQDFSDYMHDIKIAQEYAYWNRKAITDTIIKEMKLDVLDEFETIHNYIDTEYMILRKGAVSARDGEVLLIPINMRDGSLICIGKGNDNWNQSACHGAGRIMSRGEAKETFTLSEFKKTMKEAGIYSTSVSQDTLDEAPMVYKPMNEIIQNIQDTVTIKEIIKPIYNFKAGKE